MAYIGRDPAYGNLVKQTLTPNSVTTNFALDYPVATAASILVSVGGVVQAPETAYSIINGYTLSFSEAPATGLETFIIYLGRTSELNTVVDGAITEIKLVANAVTSSKIADGNVTTSKIADSAITTVKIADGNVTLAKIADGAVSSAKVANFAISSAKLDNSITVSNVLTVGNNIVIGNSVTANTITSNSITVSGNISVLGNVRVTGAQGVVAGNISSTTGLVTVDGNVRVLGAQGVITGNVTAPSSILTLDGNVNVTTKLTVVGTSSFAGLKISDVLETATTSATAATGTINFDVTTQAVLYYTTNASGNWTVNFRGSAGTSLNNLMATGESLTAVFLVTQGATAYYNSAVQVDGSSVTPKWQGGTAPTAGNVNSVDVYSYTIFKTGAATFTVFASQTRFA